MQPMTLRNDSLDTGAWFVTATVASLVGIAALTGLVVMNVLDAKALWLGPAVKYPQAVYLFLQGLTLACLLPVAWLAIDKGRRFFDDSVQLVLDAEAIHDHRPGGRRVLWSEVASVVGRQQSVEQTVITALLVVTLLDGEQVAFDIFGLDERHEAIVAAAEECVARST